MPKCCRRLAGKDVSLLGSPLCEERSPIPAFSTHCTVAGLGLLCTAPGGDPASQPLVCTALGRFQQALIALCSPSCLSKHLFFPDPPFLSRAVALQPICFIFKCLLEGYYWRNLQEQLKPKRNA